MKARARPYRLDWAFGKAGEGDPRIRDILGRLYPRHRLVPASPQADYRGVDFWLIRKVGDEWARVGGQVKRRRGPFAGKVFVEWVADLDRGIPGWAVDPVADLLVIVHQNAVMVFHFPALSRLAHERAPLWEDQGWGAMTKTRRDGRTYHAYGFWVPLEDLAPALLHIEPPRANTGETCRWASCRSFSASRT